MKSLHDMATPGCVVTIGTFDGVHRGHKAVIACLKRESAKRGLRPLVVTFDRTRSNSWLPTVPRTDNAP